MIVWNNQILVYNFNLTYVYSILLPDFFSHLGAASGRMSTSGLSRHSKPAAHTPQKKLVDGLKQSPHDSPSCLVSFSKSFKINYKVYYGTQHVIFSPDNLEIWKLGRLTYHTVHCPDWIHSLLVLNMPLRCHLKDIVHHMLSHHSLVRSRDFPQRWHKILLHRKLLLRNWGSCKLNHIRFLYMLGHIRLVLKWKEKQHRFNISLSNKENQFQDLEND